MLKGATNLSGQQAQAVLLLTEGKTSNEVAKQLGVDPGMLSEWRQEAAFEAALNRQHDELLSANTRRLRSLLSKAVDTLEELLGDEEAPAGVRLSAAIQLLKLGNLGKHVEAKPGPTTAEGIEKARAEAAMFEDLLSPFGR
jgi:transposase-like protein